MPPAILEPEAEVFKDQLCWSFPFDSRGYASQTHSPEAVSTHGVSIVGADGPEVVAELPGVQGWPCLEDCGYQ